MPNYRSQPPPARAAGGSGGSSMRRFHSGSGHVGMARQGSGSSMGMTRSRTTSPPRFSWKAPLRSLTKALLLPGGPTPEEEAASADQLIEEAQLREAILHELTHALQALVKEEVDISASKQEPVELVVLEGSLPGVQNLCQAVEQACLHGIKTASFHGQLPFWDLCEALVEREKTQSNDKDDARGPFPPANEYGSPATPEEVAEERQALNQLVEYVRRNTVLRTPVGKARCFLRHALHDGTLAAVMRHVIKRPAHELALFYHSESILLHAEDAALLLEILGSLTEHFRLDLTGEMDAPLLDHEPLWPLLDLATTTARRRRESEERKDRGILAATLIADLTHWRLEEENEVKTLEAFQKVESFNSSAQRAAQRDPVLDALLETSGVTLRHFKSGSGGGGSFRSEGEGGGEGEVVEIVEIGRAGTGVGESCHHLLHMRQHGRVPSGLLTCPASPKHQLRTCSSLPSSPTHGRLSASAQAGRNAMTPTHHHHTVATQAAHANRHTPIRFSTPSRLSGQDAAAHPHDDDEIHHGASSPSSPDDSTELHGPVIVPSKDFLLSPGRPRGQHAAGHQHRKLFGAPLAHLVRDVETCRFALLEPSLGVPYIFEAMLGFLEVYLTDTPRLFETKVASWRVSGLSKVLDETQEVPPGSDPHVVAATLNLGLRMLPEPLLTYEAYHAFLTAARLTDKTHRQEATKALLRDSLPLEHKPTLRRLMHLLWKACHTHLAHPSSSTASPPSSSSKILAPIFCRSLLRNYLPEEEGAGKKALPPTTRDPPEVVALVQSLIDEFPILFHDLREEEATKGRALQEKIRRLGTIVEDSKKPANGETDPECLALFHSLFAFLARVEERAHHASHVTMSPPTRVVTDDYGCLVGGGPGSRTPPPSGARRRSHSLPEASDLLRAAENDLLRTRSPEEAKRASANTSPTNASPARRHGVRAGVAGTSKSILPTEEEMVDADAEEDAEALADTTPFSLVHPRWECCGFIRGDPGCEFGLSGKLTLKCIVRFIRRFPCIAAEMVFQYGHHGHKGSTIPFPALCGQVTRMVLGLLHLLPPADGQPLSIADFAEAPYWRLLDDEYAVEEVFCVALTLVDFLHFHEALRFDQVQPHILETKRQVSWALAQGPISVHSLWELWLAVRAELRRRYQEAHRKEKAQARFAGAGRRRVGGNEEDVVDAEVSARTTDLACFFEAVSEDENVVSKISKGVRSRMFGRSSILQPWQVITLERSLPEEHQDRDWLLLYSLKKHGAALHSIFEKCKGHRYSLLCLMDSDGVVFGGMASDEWRDRKDKYFGSGESFLFTFKGDRYVCGWLVGGGLFIHASIYRSIFSLTHPPTHIQVPKV